MSKTQKFQARRAKLMAEDPRCRNCRVSVVYFKPRPGERLPDNFATIQHVNSRNQSRPRPAQGKTTLWCLRCNHDDGAAEQAALGVAELQRRSAWRDSKQVAA